MLFFSSNSSSDSQVKWCGFWLVCDLSCHQPVWSEGQCYGKPSDSVPRLLDFSWDRDMKGCLIAYQENEINAVPSMYNSMWWHDCLFDFWEYCYPSQQEFLHSSHCCKTKTTNKPNNKKKEWLRSISERAGLDSTAVNCWPLAWWDRDSHWWENSCFFSFTFSRRKK